MKIPHLAFALIVLAGCSSSGDAPGLDVDFNALVSESLEIVTADDDLLGLQEVIRGETIPITKDGCFEEVVVLSTPVDFDLPESVGPYKVTEFHPSWFKRKPGENPIAYLRVCAFETADVKRVRVAKEFVTPEGEEPDQVPNVAVAFVHEDGTWITEKVTQSMEEPRRGRLSSATTIESDSDATTENGPDND